MTKKKPKIIEIVPIILLLIALILQFNANGNLEGDISMLKWRVCELEKKHNYQNVCE